MSQPSYRTDRTWISQGKAVVGIRRARNIKTDASHPMYKLKQTRICKMLVLSFLLPWAKGLLCHSSYASHITRRRSGSWSSFRHSINRNPWICMQGARNIRKCWKRKKKKNISPEQVKSLRETVWVGDFQKAFHPNRVLGCPKKRKKRLKLG